MGSFSYDLKMQTQTLASSPNFKFPITLSDGLIIEAVYYGSGTLCISSQAGCALACPFCASGSQGLKRQLTVAEMQLQLQQFRDTGGEPRRLTISGIGEPLQNWENVRNFICNCQKLGLSVSVTTTGVALTHLEELINLATSGVMISLHAADAESHRRLIPKGPDFTHLCSEIDRIYPLVSRRKRRKLGINYLLFKGINDRKDDLLALQKLMKRWPDFTLHLLSYNQIGEIDFHSDGAKMDVWHDYLKNKGISVRRPNRWRNSVDGGCGTLFLSSLDMTKNARPE
jgi:23S rRNA (adenine2503-C2)-methyltransferase